MLQLCGCKELLAKIFFHLLLHHHHVLLLLLHLLLLVELAHGRQWPSSATAALPLPLLLLLLLLLLLHGVGVVLRVVVGVVVVRVRRAQRVPVVEVGVAMVVGMVVRVVGHPAAAHHSHHPRGESPGSHSARGPGSAPHPHAVHGRRVVRAEGTPVVVVVVVVEGAAGLGLK